MLISMAYAQDVSADTATMVDTPNTVSAFAWNIGLILVMVAMFYLLLIKPQQKRFQAHKQMMDGLKKGDKVITAGGLVGKIDTIIDDKEVVIDLGNNVKVTAMRQTLSDVVSDKK